MTGTSLTPTEIAQLKSTIEIAREGRATMRQRGAAHDIALHAIPPLPGCAAELRAHIRALAADHDEGQKALARDVFSGVVSGVITTAILGSL